MISIILALILISFIFAPLGTIALWKRYVYFGDGLAHSSFLAVSISIIAHFSLIYSGIFIAIFFAVLVFVLKDYSSRNATINLISSFMLALALTINYLYSSAQNNTNLLFGDILLTSDQDLIFLTILLVAIACFIILFYNQIILIIINRDIAIIKGINVKMIELIFLLLLSFSVFSTIKIVGALMVSAILLIPSMFARLISKNPKQMIIIAIITSLVINMCSSIASFYLDLPLAPIIIIIGSIMYGGLYLYTRLYSTTIG